MKSVLLTIIWMLFYSTSMIGQKSNIEINHQYILNEVCLFFEIQNNTNSLDELEVEIIQSIPVEQEQKKQRIATLFSILKENKNNRDTLLFIKALTTLGEHTLLEKQYSKSIQYLEKAKLALNQFSQRTNATLHSQIETYYLLGLCYFDGYEFDEALLHFEQLNTFIDTVQFIHQNDIARIKNDIGVAYFYIKDYIKANQYFNESLDEQPTDKAILVSTHINLAHLYLTKINEIDDKEPYLDSIKTEIATIRKLSKDTNIQVDKYLNYLNGSVHLLNNEVNKAKRDLKKALDDEKFNSSNQLNTILNNQYQLSKIVNVALAQVDFSQQPSIPKTQIHAIAKTRAYQHTLVNGKEFYTRQIKKLKQSTQSIITTSNPNSEIYKEQLRAFDNLLNYSIKQPLNSNMPNTYELYLIKALNAFLKRIERFEDEINYTSNQTSQAVLTETYIETFEDAIAIAFELGYYDLIWVLIEQSKARSLNQLIFEKHIDNKSGSKKLREQYQQYNSLCIQIDNLYQKYDKEKKDFLPIGLQQAIRELKILDGKIREQTRNYQKSKTTNTSIETIQAQLSDNELMINYFMGKTYSIAVVIHQKYASIVPLGKTDSILQAIYLFENYIENAILHFRGKKTINLEPLCFEANSKLYQFLVAPIKDARLIEDGSTLIIIPSNELAILPFEILTSNTVKPEDYGHFNYLVYNHSIQYHISADLWLKSFSKNIQPKNNTKKILRLQGENDNLSPYTLGVMDNLFDSDIILNQDKFDFKSLDFQQYQIIDFFTHGILNEDEPLLNHLSFFNNQQLFLYDIAQLNLSNQLVILEACDGKRGQLVRGEGTISLTRGFLIAGASQVITSLWQIQVAETDKFFSGFYLQIHKENTDDYQKVLRDIQLQYAKNGYDPYLWSGFIFLGH